MRLAAIRRVDEPETVQHAGICTARSGIWSVEIQLPSYAEAVSE